MLKRVNFRQIHEDEIGVRRTALIVIWTMAPHGRKKIFKKEQPVMAVLGLIGPYFLGSRTFLHLIIKLGLFRFIPLVQLQFNIWKNDLKKVSNSSFWVSKYIKHDSLSNLVACINEKVEIERKNFQHSV